MKRNKIMCNTCEWSIPLAGVVIIISILVITSTMNSQPSTNIHNFTIETISATCMTEGQNLDVRSDGNSIIISVPIKTPNPCYDVKGDVKINDKNIEVDLSTVAKPEICIGCIGEVTGKVTINNLSKGTYSVKIITPDKSTTTNVEIG